METVKRQLMGRVTLEGGVGVLVAAQWVVVAWEPGAGPGQEQEEGDQTGDEQDG